MFFVIQHQNENTRLSLINRIKYYVKYYVYDIIFQRIFLALMFHLQRRRKRLSFLKVINSTTSPGVVNRSIGLKTRKRIHTEPNIRRRRQVGRRVQIIT